MIEPLQAPEVFNRRAAEMHLQALSQARSEYHPHSFADNHRVFFEERLDPGWKPKPVEQVDVDSPHDECGETRKLRFVVDIEIAVESKSSSEDVLNYIMDAIGEGSDDRDDLRMKAYDVTDVAIEEGATF